jgi:hypothetical protein
MKGEKDKLWPVLQKLGICMKNEDKDLVGKASMKCVMKSWLLVSNTLQMMISHIDFNPLDKLMLILHLSQHMCLGTNIIIFI